MYQQKTILLNCPPMVAKKSKLVLCVYGFLHLFVVSLCLLNTHSFSFHLSQTCAHKGRNPNISPSHISFCFTPSVFFCCPYLLLNLPSLSEPEPLPTSHGAISSSVLRCIYYRGLMQSPTLRRSQSHLLPYCPFLPPRTPQTLSHSLLFMALFHHVFLHAYYRGLPYASGMAPMKYLNNLSPPVCLATL